MSRTIATFPRGTVSDVRWKAPYLVADLAVWDADAIARIRDGSQKEISCAYRYRAVVESGTVGGAPFDLRMIEISGNHVALVPEGRVGRDVVVADAALDIEIEIDMAAAIRGYRRLP